jgi:hypothetical protein
MQNTNLNSGTSAGPPTSPNVTVNASSDAQVDRDVEMEELHDDVSADNQEQSANTSSKDPSAEANPNELPSLGRLDVDGMTYEQARANNIARNKALLMALGLDTATKHLTAGLKLTGSNTDKDANQKPEDRAIKAKKTRGRKKSAQAKAPARRSQRNEK